MKWLRASTLCFSLVCAESLAANTEVTAAGIEADLSAKGGRYVIDHYFYCSDSGGPGYGLVEMGTPAAVRLAVTILEYSDACTTELLQSALGTAMTRAPLVVLPYVDKTPLLRANAICLPWIDADEPRAEQAAVISRARLSLLSVRAGTLENQRAACLSAIRSFE